MTNPLHVLASLAMPSGWCKIRRNGTGAGGSSTSTRGNFFVTGARRATGIKSKLANFVEQRLVTDAEHLGRILAAPVSFFESIADCFHLGFVLQTADERFQSLFAHGRGFFSWRNPLARCRHFQQLAEAAFIIFQNDVTLYEIFEFAKISGPGITYGGFHQMLGRNHGLLVEFLAVLLKEMAEEQRNFRGPLA